MSYSMSGSYLSSPDTSSPVYPDRLIRPLPKRSLRSRLSEEAAESIPFPPNPPSSSLPIYNQYGENGDYVSEGKVHVQHDQHTCGFGHEHEDDEYEHEHHHHHDDEDDHHHCHHNHHHHCHHDDEERDIDSAEDGSPMIMRRTGANRSSVRSPRSARQARYGGHTAKSSSSGLDGYDAFENTNNKKKRKIPTSGSMGFHGSSLSAELAHLGLNGEDGAGTGQYYGSGNAAMPAGMGMQGAGRGRNARRSSGRNPLGISSNGTNVRSAWHEQTPPPSTVDLRGGGPIQSQEQGIISAAIARATSLLRNSLSQGQENIGVLEQDIKTTPKDSQFTFTCEGDAGKGVQFPEQSMFAPGYPQRVNNMPAPASAANQKFTTHGTQTSPNMAAQNNQHMPPPAQAPSGQTQAQGKQPRRRKGDVLALASKQRRLQQEYANLSHPPAPEDIWICEFCEYESIFGVQPHALIRQYEVKDRRIRKQLAEKRRLLEKAKLKGRKGKKQSKNAAKNNNAAQPTANQQSYDQQPVDPMPGDDYLDDGYDDDPIAMPAPPPQAPVKQPMPGSFDSYGKAGGGGTAKPGAG